MLTLRKRQVFWLSSACTAFPPRCRSSGFWRVQTSFIKDYSCRYSSGLAPDSLASAGGCVCPITVSGGKDKEFYTLFCLLSLINFRISLSLSPNWFRADVSAVRIKRESGANPGQSRCCEAPPLRSLDKEPLPLIAVVYREGIKTRSQSEDLPFIEVCLYSWDRKAVRTQVNVFKYE